MSIYLYMCVCVCMCMCVCVCVCVYRKSERSQITLKRDEVEESRDINNKRISFVLMLVAPLTIILKFMCYHKA
jgi:hypothetical protein